MLILAIILLAIPFLVGFAIGRSGCEHLRRELAYALGRLKESNDKADKMTEIAREAVSAAREKHFPSQTRSKFGSINVPIGYYHADPDPFQVKNCPRCGISIRSDDWPRQCANSKCLFFFGDDWPEEFPILPD